jgi:hypothetical protein
LKIKYYISANAITFIALGIGFGLYAPLIAAFFGIPEIPSEDVLLYWTVISFIRLYGAAMFGVGLVILAVQNYLSNQTANARRGLLFSLVLANLMGAVVSATQNALVWQSAAGWILTGIYAIFTLIGALFLFTKLGENE